PAPPGPGGVAPHPRRGGAVSDDPIEPDPVIETALRLLPVPEHEAGFWQRFSATLADEPVPEPTRVPEPRAGEPGRDGTAEVPVLELVSTDHLALVPPAVRRGSNLILSAVAVAAAVVVVVAA